MKVIRVLVFFSLSPQLTSFGNITQIIKDMGLGAYRKARECPQPPNYIADYIPFQ